MDTDGLKALLSILGKVLVSYAMDLRDFQFGQMEIDEEKVKELHFIATKVCAILEDSSELIDPHTHTNLRASMTVLQKVADRYDRENGIESGDEKNKKKEG